VSKQPYPGLRFGRQKDRIPHPLFCQIKNRVGQILTTVNMVDWELSD